MRKMMVGPVVACCVVSLSQGRAQAVDAAEWVPAPVAASASEALKAALAEADAGVTVGLIPCAVGGTPLSRWSKGGDLYAQAHVRVQAALKNGTLKGILWHQGENDAGTEATARNYAERLAKMVKDLRADLGAGDVPFVAGKLGEFLQRQDKDGKPSHWPLVNEQIASLPKLAPTCAVVESTGLKAKSDQVHFDTPSLREFGQRYAEAMKKLQAAR